MRKYSKNEAPPDKPGYRPRPGKYNFHTMEPGDVLVLEPGDPGTEPIGSTELQGVYRPRVANAARQYASRKGWCFRITVQEDRSVRVERVF